MILVELKKRYNIEEVIFVADRGMLSGDNLDYLEENGLHYIVGSRLKTLKKEQQKWRIFREYAIAGHEINI